MITRTHNFMCSVNVIRQNFSSFLAGHRPALCCTRSNAFALDLCYPCCTSSSIKAAQTHRPKELWRNLPSVKGAISNLDLSCFILKAIRVNANKCEPIR